MDEVLRQLPKKAKEKHSENKKFFAKLKKKTPKNLDYIMQELHEAEFKRTDCLTCANCCKTTGPLFTNADVERISKSFRMKPQKFIDTYLRIDEENDFVLQQVPWIFYFDLQEFPHTDRKKFQQISNLTLKNVEICPAAYTIVEEMKKLMK